MAVHGRYLVFFRNLPGENAVRLERVLHGARNLPRLFN
jgi:plasmid stabilization system protein ParE